MPRIDLRTNQDVRDSQYFWARITNINTTNDTANIVEIDENKNTISQTYNDIPIYYHCEENPIENPNGSLKGGSSAFKVDDDVFVLRYPVKVLGHLDKIVPCSRTTVLVGAFYKGTPMYFVWDVEKNNYAEGIINRITGSPILQNNWPVEYYAISLWRAKQTNIGSPLLDVDYNNEIDIYKMISNVPDEPWWRMFGWNPTWGPFPPTETNYLGPYSYDEFGKNDIVPGRDFEPLIGKDGYSYIACTGFTPGEEGGYYTYYYWGPYDNSIPSDDEMRWVNAIDLKYSKCTSLNNVEDSRNALVARYIKEYVNWTSCGFIPGVYNYQDVCYYGPASGHLYSIPQMDDGYAYGEGQYTYWENEFRPLGFMYNEDGKPYFTNRFQLKEYSQYSPTIQVFIESGSSFVFSRESGSSYASTEAFWKFNSNLKVYPNEDAADHNPFDDNIYYNEPFQAAVERCWESVSDGLLVTDSPVTVCNAGEWWCRWNNQISPGHTTWYIAIYEGSVS